MMRGLRTFTAAAGACWLGFAVQAQTNTGSPPAPASAPVPAATDTEPTSTTMPDNTRYQNSPRLLAACAERLSEFGNKPCDIIFIGDTLTTNWLYTGKAIWDKNYATRNALNFAVDGDKTQNVLWRLNNMDVQSLKPKVAVVLIGSYNTANTPHEIADGVKAVLANTQAIFAGVKIILVSIPPNTRDDDAMMQANSIIRSYADQSSVYYLDLVSLMPLDNGRWKGVSTDGLLLDASGYQIWADAMEPVLSKLMSGQ